jgi:hypothetical protein
MNINGVPIIIIMRRITSFPAGNANKITTVVYKRKSKRVKNDIGEARTIVKTIRKLTVSTNRRLIRPCHFGSSRYVRTKYTVMVTR